MMTEVSHMYCKVHKSNETEVSSSRIFHSEGSGAQLVIPNSYPVITSFWIGIKLQFCNTTFQAWDMKQDREILKEALDPWCLSHQLISQGKKELFSRYIVLIDGIFTMELISQASSSALVTAMGCSHNPSCKGKGGFSGTQNTAQSQKADHVVAGMRMLRVYARHWMMPVKGLRTSSHWQTTDIAEDSWKTPSYVLDRHQTVLVQPGTSCLVRPAHFPTMIAFPAHSPSLSNLHLTLLPQLPSWTIFISAPIFSSQTWSFLLSSSPAAPPFSRSLFFQLDLQCCVSVWTPSASYYPSPQFNSPH